MILRYLRKLLMLKLFGLEILNNLDLTFISKNNHQRLNLVVVFSFDNFDVDKIRTALIKGIDKIPRFSSKLVRKFFGYYWKRVTQEELHKNIKIVDKIYKSEEEFIDYAKKEVNNYIEVLNHLPYSIEFIKYSENNRGGMIFKFDHALSDGLGIVAAICSMADNYDPHMFPNVMSRSKPSPWLMHLQSLIDNLLFVFYCPLVLYNSIIVKRPKTPFKDHTRPNKNNTIVHISKEYKIDDYKEFRMKHRISFNDLYVSIISATLNKICKENNFNNIKSFVSFIPIGKTDIPADTETVHIENTASGINTEIPAINNVTEQCKLVSKRILPQLRNSALANTILNISLFVNEFMPSDVINKLGDDGFKNTDFNCTNVAGPTRDLIIGEGRVKSVFAISSAGRFKFFLPLVSYNKKFRFILSMNDCLDVDGDRVLAYIDDCFKEILK
jgi:hypothetical protein